MSTNTPDDQPPVGLVGVSRRSKARPPYLQVAEDLRSLILKGTLAAGDKLPSEWDISRQYGVSRPLASRAVAVLRSEGLVESRQGSGSFVRPQRPLRHPNNYRYEATSGHRPMFSTDVASVGAEPSWESHSAPGHASPVIARRLDLSLGDEVMVTHYRFFADDEPTQMSVSYEPMELTRGTPVELPEEGEVRGVRARMESIGIMVDNVTEDVNLRPAREFESEHLDIPAGVGVFVIERTYWFRERPVETCDIVIPGDRYTLRYRIPLS